jgi:hypothetical protein
MFAEMSLLYNKTHMGSNTILGLREDLTTTLFFMFLMVSYVNVAFFNVFLKISFQIY